MKRIACVAGARPNFMKVKPVLDALDRRGAITTLVHTGQHYDAAMSDVFFDDIGLRQPDVHLGVGSGSQAEQTARVMVAFEAAFDELRPDVVVVPGDVNSTVACAMVAAKAGCLVAHVEAGLRSRDWGMPEEINRVVTDRLSDYLLAPSDEAAGNLQAEGYGKDQIHIVGNVMIDTLLANLDHARSRTTLADLGVRQGEYCLATLHRPSNVDDPRVLDGLVRALAEIGQDLPVILPAHPRTRPHLRDVPASVQVVDPQGYLDFIALQAGAALVVTDSGGVQEETTVLGVPCLTARQSTERPITVTEGTNRVVGTDPEVLVAAAREVLAHPPGARRPDLWDGRAGERVADVLLDAAEPLRPTELRSF